ncbi:MAG TPA: hypothetical protein DIW50_03400 [Prolixibacteraceae bacterium]|nr:hypothetical protein [Prolixibacteraceae bacterium]
MKVVKPGVYLVLRLLLTIKNILKLYIVEKGILSEELVKAVSKKMDTDINLSKIKLIGPVVELFDDKLINLALTYLDDKWGEKVPEKARPAIVALLDAYVSGDWSAVTDEVTETVNSFIDIPLLDEDFEGNLIKGLLEAVIKFVKSKKQ